MLEIDNPTIVNPYIHGTGNLASATFCSIQHAAQYSYDKKIAWSTLIEEINRLW